MIDSLNHWFGYIQDRYGVSPLIFGIIYIASFAPCWYCVFRILRALKRKERQRYIFWTGIFILFFVAPYAYVYLFGHNYPVWFHVIFGMIVVLSAAMTARKIKKMTAQKAAS